MVFYRLFLSLFTLITLYNVCVVDGDVTGFTPNCDTILNSNLLVWKNGPVKSVQKFKSIININKEAAKYHTQNNKQRIRGNDDRKSRIVTPNNTPKRKQRYKILSQPPNSKKHRHKLIHLKHERKNKKTAALRKKKYIFKRRGRKPI